MMTIRDFTGCHVTECCTEGALSKGSLIGFIVKPPSRQALRMARLLDGFQ
jgi:hypothetical protein